MVLSEDAILASILTQETFLSCFQRSSKNKFLLPTLSVRKLAEIFQESDSHLRHNHILIGISWGLELEVCVDWEAMMVRSIRNTDGETQLLTLPFSFKTDPKDLHKNNAFPTDPHLGMPGPSTSRI